MSFYIYIYQFTLLLSDVIIRMIYCLENHCILPLISALDSFGFRFYISHA